MLIVDFWVRVLFVLIGLLFLCFFPYNTSGFVFGVVTLAGEQNVCFWKAEIKFLASLETSNIVSGFLFLLYIF